MNNQNLNVFSNLKNDIPASIVVFLVAVPLCLGIALASGAPPFAGLIAGIIGGIVVGSASGSQLGVSGPAAGLASIVAASIQELGSFDIFLFAVVVAGLIQIALGIAKAGVIGYYFPSAVIKGMLSGIGVIIVLKQIPHAFGYDKDLEGNLSFQNTDGENTFSELFNMLDYISPGAVAITIVCMIILILWEQPFIKKIKGTNIIQGSLVAVIVGTIMNQLFFKGGDWYLSGEHIVSIPVSSSFSDFMGNITFPDFSQWQNWDLYVIAATIALVASIETLLSVEATDKLDPQKRITPTNRELIAQGLGNTFSGLVGGLPVTQVIVRSSANVQSGGRTKMSAILHGILLLTSVVAIPFILNMIPMASLAAILFMVGYKLAKPELFKKMYSMGIAQFAPYVITILAIVFTDLLIGIGIGMAVSFIHILWNNFRTPYQTELEGADQGKPVTMELSEHVTFLNKASIINTLDSLPDGILFIIDARKSATIHPDVLEIFEDFIHNARTRDIRVETTGFEKWRDDEKRLTTEKE